jgi:hypothetical protein
MKLKNEFENTGEMGLEDVYNYNDWTYSEEYTEMVNAYNYQNKDTKLKKVV